MSGPVQVVSIGRTIRHDILVRANCNFHGQRPAGGLLNNPHLLSHGTSWFGHKAVRVAMRDDISVRILDLLQTTFRPKHLSLSIIIFWLRWIVPIPTETIIAHHGKAY